MMSFESAGVGGAMREQPRSLSDDFLGAVTVGERGQIVIPAEAREAYGIRGGDKLLVFHGPARCGVIVIRVEDIHRMSQAMMKFVAEMGQLNESSEGEAAETK
jgi:AbrB family looped-hinge helix DNA binding protein